MSIKQRLELLTYLALAIAMCFLLGDFTQEITDTNGILLGTVAAYTLCASLYFEFTS